MASRVLSATVRAACAKSVPLLAYKTAREELMMSPVPLAVRPDVTAA